MARYGNDKPDLRFGLELVDLSAIVVGSAFKVFAGAVAGGGQVKAVRYPGGADLSRKQIGDLEQIVKERGAAGLVTIALKADGEMASPIA
jgi:aspartyl-tRNA synthetase